MTNNNEIEILQTETHIDDLGIAFTKIGNDVWCSIDWSGGEMKFKLDFISQNFISISSLEKFIEENKKDRVDEVVIMANKDFVRPVGITEDVWFYPMEKRLDFTVYIDGKSLLFSISKKKLAKYLSEHKES